MKENHMRQDRQFYVGNAKHLQGIRKPCHVISAFTSTLFVVVWLLGQDFAADFINVLGGWSYVITFAAFAYPAVMIERKISELIDDLGHLLATMHSKRLVLLMGAVTLPFILLSGVTSFVGMAEASHQGADAFQIQQLGAMSKTFSESKKELLQTQREADIRKQRFEQRQNLEQKFSEKLAAVVPNNLSKYPNYKTNERHSRKFMQSNAKDSVAILNQKHKELDAFDKETEKQISKVIDSHNSIAKSEANAKTELIRTGKETIIGRADRLKWLGRFFGWVALISLFVSILAAVGKHFICFKFEIKDSELVEKK
jgi:hypothetical protein